MVIEARGNSDCSYSQLRLIGILLIGISGSDQDFSSDKPLLPSPAWVDGIVLCWFVCVCACYHKIAVQAQLSQNLNKLHLTNLQTVVLYKTGKFLQANTA